MGRYLRDAAEPPKEIRPLTKAETQRVLALAERRDKVEHAFILVGVLTGMRLGELLGLRWEDLDFKAKFIDVRRSRTGQRVGTPKNGKSRRVDMATALVNVLGSLKAERKRAALAAGKPMSPTVFLTPEGAPLDGDNFRKRVFHRLLEAAGIPRVGLHNLRHTYASYLIERGESLTYISRQMGHSSIQVTVDIYGHLVPGENRGAVDRLGDWLTESGAAPAVAIS
jgi:integrase